MGRLGASAGLGGLATKIRSGFVTILGRPNVGKSTLLNALVGSKIAIVADRPQTTRAALTGVVTIDSTYRYAEELLKSLPIVDTPPPTTSAAAEGPAKDKDKSKGKGKAAKPAQEKPIAQVVFLDTPGIHDPENRMGKHMMDQVRESLAERDLLLYLMDCSQTFTKRDEEALEWVRRAAAPTFLVLSKIDRVSKSQLLPLLDQYSKLHDFKEIIPIAAQTGVNLPRLVERIVAYMPEGPLYFPTDQITEQPMRFLAGEIVREKIIRHTQQELPYTNAVLVTQYEEKPALVHIAAEIFVERDGQKGIIIGAGGAMLKMIGTEARVELEAIIGQKVFLEIHVRVREGWRDDEHFLQGLDWRKMAGE